MPVRGYRQRYFAFSIDGLGAYTEKEVSVALRKTIRDLFGDFGVSSLQLKLIEYDQENREGIVRCNWSYTREMRVALALITTISDLESAVRVKGASGTLKSLKGKKVAR